MEQGPGETRWGVITFLVVTGSVAAAHLFKLSPALPFLRAEFALSLVAGGWLFSLTNGLAVAVGIAAGSFVDRFGYRRMLIAGLVVLTIAAGLGGFVQIPAVLYVLRLAEGFGYLAISIAAPSLIVREATARDRPLALGFWGIFNPAGGAAIFLAGPHLLAAGGWRGMWFGLAAATAVMLIAALVLKLRPAPARAQAPQAILTNIARTIRHAGPWLVALIFAFYTLQYSALMAWLPSVLISEKGIAVQTAGLLAAVVIAVNIIGNLVAGFLIRRGFGHGGLVILTAALMASSAALIFSPLPDLVRYMGCVGLSLFGGMIPGTAFAAVPEVAPSPAELGTVNGLVVQGSNLGQMAGPPLAAALVTFTGSWSSLFAMFVMANLVAAALGLALRKAAAKRRP